MFKGEELWYDQRTRTYRTSRAEFTEEQLEDGLYPNSTTGMMTLVETRSGSRKVIEHVMISEATITRARVSDPEYRPLKPVGNCPNCGAGRTTSLCSFCGSDA